MPGSIDNPVVLDPWQAIVEVGWPDPDPQYLMFTISTSHGTGQATSQCSPLTPHPGGEISETYIDSVSYLLRTVKDDLQQPHTGPTRIHQWGEGGWFSIGNISENLDDQITPPADLEFGIAEQYTAGSLQSPRTDPPGGVEVEDPFNEEQSVTTNFGSKPFREGTSMTIETWMRPGEGGLACLNFFGTSLYVRTIGDAAEVDSFVLDVSGISFERTIDGVVRTYRPFAMAPTYSTNESADPRFTTRVEVLCRPDPA